MFFKEANCDIVCLIKMRYEYNIYGKIQIVSISERNSKVSDKGNENKHAPLHTHASVS